MTVLNGLSHKRSADPIQELVTQQGNTQAVIPSNVEGSFFISHYHHGNGFTLVELAIALMVIGLLIGGVLKGQELVENARMTRTAKNITDYDTAVMIFRSNYNALPGDVRNPASVLPNCTDTLCSTVGTYTGTGQLRDDSAIRFWVHLERAGLISGVNENATTHRDVSPLNVFGHHDRVYYTHGVTALETSHPEQYLPMNRFFVTDFLTTTNNRYLTLRRAIRLDQKVDDGKPLTGRARVVNDAIIQVGGGVSPCYDATEFTYLDQSMARHCHLSFPLGSLQP